MRLAGGEAHDQLHGIAEIDPALDHAGQAVLAGCACGSRRTLSGRMVALVSPDICLSPRRRLQFEIAEPDPAAALAVRPAGGRPASDWRRRGSRRRRPSPAPHRHLGAARHLLDPAVGHDGDAVAHGQRLFLVVGDIDEGDADLLLQRLQLDLQLSCAAWRPARPAARPAAARRASARGRGPAPRAAAGRPDICAGLRFSKPVSWTRSSASPTRRR